MLRPAVFVVLVLCGSNTGLAQGRFATNELVPELTIPKLDSSSGLGDGRNGRNGRNNINRDESASPAARGFVGRSQGGFVGRGRQQVTNETSNRDQRFQLRPPSSDAFKRQGEENISKGPETRIAFRWRPGWSIPPKSDAQLTNRLAQISKSFELRYNSKLLITLKRNGVVAVDGLVHSPRERAVAEILVRMEPGVKEVKNLVQIVPSVYRPR